MGVDLAKAGLANTTNGATRDPNHVVDVIDVWGGVHNVHVSRIECPNRCARVSVQPENPIVGCAASTNISGGNDDEVKGIEVTHAAERLHLDRWGRQETAASTSGQDGGLPQQDARVCAEGINSAVASGHISDRADILAGGVGCVARSDERRPSLDRSTGNT